MLKTLSLFWDGFTKWRIWCSLAWIDLSGRYRRTTLGPWWVMLGTGLVLGGMGAAWGTIFNMKLREFFPYMVAGYVPWMIWAEFLTVGCGTFKKPPASTIIKNIPMNHFVHAYRLTMGTMISFAHNIVVFIAVALIAQSTELSFWIILVFPGLMMTFFIGVSLTTIFGMIGARFADFELAVSSLIVFFFLATPIMWHADGEGGRGMIALLNPMTHLIEIVRAPLLGQPPALISWYISLGIASVTFVAALWLFKKRGHRIVFWL